MTEKSVPNLIQAFELEAIVASLRKKAQQVKVKLPTDAALYMAQNLRSNERALDLALVRLIAHSRLTGTAITLACTQRVLQDFIDAQGHNVPVNSLPDLPSLRFGTKETKIKFQDSIAADRQCVFFLKIQDGSKTSRVRHELEVNMRESERERLAKRDAYERELERRTKKRKQA